MGIIKLSFSFIVGGYITDIGFESFLFLWVSFSFEIVSLLSSDSVEVLDWCDVEVNLL